MKIVISSGHGQYIRGASGYLDEVNEARRVVAAVAQLWRTSGVGVDEFHDNTSTSQNQNLNTIVNYHNSRSRDLDVSVHFNAYQTTSSPMGTECLYVTQSKLASDVALAIAQAGGLINRGGKKRTDLFFLNNTAKPAILIEVCFVDSKADADLYNKNFDAICRRIAEVVGKVTIGTTPPVEPEVPPTEPPPDDTTARVDMTIKTTGKVIVSINGQDFMVSTPGPEDPSSPSFPANQQNIIATVFQDNSTAYPPYDAITNSELSVSLPYKFQGTRPKVLVNKVDSELSVTCEIRDVGPWFTDDPYWETGARPLAETCYLNNEPCPRGPHQGKVPNGAGIDLSPALASKLGISGKGQVNWKFEEPVA